MNDVILPNKRDLRKIKKRIGHVAFIQVLNDIRKHLEQGDVTEPKGTRIKDLQNQYLSPQYRLRSGDYRVFYNVERKMILSDRVFVIDIIHKKDWDFWLKTYGEIK